MTFLDLKRIKFGDKVKIIKVKTPLMEANFHEDANNDPHWWDALGKFYFCNTIQEMKTASENSFVTYYRVDGRPTRASFTVLFKVNFFVFFVSITDDPQMLYCLGKGSNGSCLPFPGLIQYSDLINLQTWYRLTDGPMDEQMDGWTHPLVEIQSKKIQR